LEHKNTQLSAITKDFLFFSIATESKQWAYPNGVMTSR
jgi:hypothetical protein